MTEPFKPKRVELISYSGMPRKEQEAILVRNVYRLLDLYAKGEPYGNRLQQTKHAVGVYALDNATSGFSQALLGACQVLDDRRDGFTMLQNAATMLNKRGFLLGLDVLETVALEDKEGEECLDFFLRKGLAANDSDIVRRVLDSLDSRRRAEHGL